MSINEVAQKLEEIYSNLQFETLREILSKDFIAHGTHLPAPMNQDQFIEFLIILCDASSDIDFHPSISDLNDRTFKLNWQLSGTHTDTLGLSSIGMPDFNATHQQFSLPKDAYLVMVEDKQITKITITPVTGGGIQGLLRQLHLI